MGEYSTQEERSPLPYDDEKDDGDDNCYLAMLGEATARTKLYYLRVLIIFFCEGLRTQTSPFATSSLFEIEDHTEATKN